MLTRELVSLIKMEAASWSRELIYGLINDVQFMMTCKPLMETRIIDPLTGDDPLMTLTASTYQYRANSTIITTFPTDTSAWLVTDVYDGNYSDDTFSPISVVTTEGDQTYAAQITFNSNLHTVTTGLQHKVRAYKSPTLITSEDIQLSVQPRFHLSHVYEGVMGRIESVENGGTSKRWENFYNNLIQRYWDEMNKKIDQQVKLRYRNF